MKIKWSTEAKQNYFDTLDYWEEHNASYEYPLKIIRAVELTEIEIAENTYFCAKSSLRISTDHHYVGFNFDLSSILCK